jgi:predicted ATP-grasp superfamily ATP-dependent carboligase
LSLSLSVLIFEYFTGGGFADSPSLPTVLSEAYAMVNALLRDFSRNTCYEPVLMLDKKLADVIEPLAAKKIVRVASGAELEIALRATLSQVDAALLVAPETNGILLKMTEVAEEEGTPVLLGSSSDAVRSVSSKEKAVEVARSAGLTVPNTITTSTDENETTIHGLARDIGYPVVIKPSEGAGCDRVFFAKDRQELSRGLKNFGGERSRTRLLLQEYIKGIDASVSILSSKSRHVIPLSFNRQMIEIRSPKDECSKYEGGYTPFEHSMSSQTYNSARKVAEAIKGLRGYVGIDFVLTSEKPVFMEVNARITTSYVGLSRVLIADGSQGVAPSIVRATKSDELPSQIEFRGTAYYSKFKLKADLNVDRDMIDVLSNLEYVESPPFPNTEGGNEGFLVNVGGSLDEASVLKSRNEKKFEKISLRLEKKSDKKMYSED